MELVKTKQLADALGLSKKTLLEKARNGGWAYVQKGNSLCFVENRLPTDVRFALAAYKSGSVVPVQKREIVAKTAESGRHYTGDAFLNASDKAQTVTQWRAALIYEYKQCVIRTLFLSAQIL